jgi:Tfp pilus assembly protein PilF
MAYYNRAVISVEKGDTKRAIEDYKTALKIDPDNVSLKEAIDKAAERARVK